MDHRLGGGGVLTRACVRASTCAGPENVNTLNNVVVQTLRAIKPNVESKSKKRIVVSFYAAQTWATRFVKKTEILLQSFKRQVEYLTYGK